MPQFIYTVIDAQHHQTSGTVAAPDRESALRQVSKGQVTVVGLEELRERRPFFEPGITGDDLLVFTQQIATMLKSGLNLKLALDVLLQDMENPTLRRTVGALAADLAEGKQLSQAMAEHTAVFPRMYIHMVQAGEASGSLAEILAQLAVYVEQAEHLKRRVKAALYYPVFVLGAAFVISTFIFVFGVHQFQQIYAGFNAPLPLLTRIIIQLGDVVWNWWWAILLAMVATGALLLRWARTERGQFTLDRIFLAVPVLGPLLRRVAIARFARTLSNLYSSGVPLLTSLELVAGSMGNRVLENVVLGTAQNVKEGESITRPLRESGIFTPMSISMIATGEESGSLDVTLKEVADFYDSQIDMMLRGLISLVEPVVILCVGVFVAVLIIALGLPLLNLVEILGQ